MGLILYSKEDVGNILEAVWLAGEIPEELKDPHEHSIIYRQGFTRALAAIAMAFGLVARDHFVEREEQ